MKKTCLLIGFLVLSTCFFSCDSKQSNSKLNTEKSEYTHDSASIDTVSPEQKELDSYGICSRQ